MSHWKSFKSNVLEDVNTKTLEKALNNMGLGLDTNIKEIRNAWGQEKVDAGLLLNNNKSSLGFKFIDNKKDNKSVKSLSLVGDFFSTGLNEKTFIDQLSQKYQEERIKTKLEESNWMIDEEQYKTTQQGEIVMEFTQWA